MMRIIDLEIGTEVQIETSYTNWDRTDNEFYCTVSDISEDGILAYRRAMAMICP